MKRTLPDVASGEWVEKHWIRDMSKIQGSKTERGRKKREREKVDRVKIL